METFIQRMKPTKIELIEHRGQYRVELKGLSDTEKIELVRTLAESTEEWGQWRFTNEAWLIPLSQVVVLFMAETGGACRGLAENPPDDPHWRP